MRCFVFEEDLDFLELLQFKLYWIRLLRLLESILMPTPILSRLLFLKLMRH